MSCKNCRRGIRSAILDNDTDLRDERLLEETESRYRPGCNACGTACGYWPYPPCTGPTGPTGPRGATGATGAT
ncbi:MAG: hypothetical protein Q4E18_15420, partial [Clostridia bacterium]|nr:hypothetical protein [Clostridia bacterium]